MKSIGILTFHGVTNYGAVLQAYALSRCIQNKGVNCEIIDYQNKVLKKQYNPFSAINLNMKHPKRFIKNLLLIPHILIRNRRFKKFRYEYLSMSKPVTENNIDTISEEYDVLISGSDQIWNFNCNGNDKNYFLNFAKNQNVICYSYAASTSTAFFTEEIKSLYSELLQHYRMISVRERTTIEKLKDIINKEVRVDIDPTLLLDREEWAKMALAPVEDKYILVFLMTHSHYILEQAYLLAQEKGLKVIYINLYEPFINKKYNSKYSISPNQWLGYIQNASYIITNSFHGTVFSLIFEKQFAVYVIGDEGKNERITQLMTITGIEGYVLREKDELVFNNIDYKEVQVRLDSEKKKSLDYITRIINGY